MSLLAHAAAIGALAASGPPVPPAEAPGVINIEIFNSAAGGSPALQSEAQAAALPEAGEPARPVEEPARAEKNAAPAKTAAQARKKPEAVKKLSGRGERKEAGQGGNGSSGLPEAPSPRGSAEAGGRAGSGAISAPEPPGAGSRPAPVYPELARRRGQQGRVLLRCLVDAGGRVTGVEIVESSGYSMLDNAAEQAVRRWHFSPARNAGLPVAGSAVVPVEFRLK